MANLKRGLLLFALILLFVGVLFSCQNQGNDNIMGSTNDNSDLISDLPVECRDSIVTIYPSPIENSEKMETFILDYREFMGQMHSVSVNRLNSPVYRTEASTNYGVGSSFPEFTSFDFDGPVMIEVEAKYEVKCVEILPTRKNISCEVIDGIIQFVIREPGQYFVKINGDENNGATAQYPLYIFANEPEGNVPSADDSDVVYFGPGFYNFKTYRLKSNTTYYFAPGAYVCGQFVTGKAKNIKLCGRGILNGSLITAERNQGRLIRISDSENITLEGITIVHPFYWTIEFNGCKDIVVDNIKTISHGMSSDALDIVGTSNVVVENSFFRAHDDLVVLKSTVAPCSEIVVKNCVMWCDSSNPMEIGYETEHDIFNVTFETIDVISQSKPPVYTSEAIFAIEPHNEGDIYNICYRDIRVDLRLNTPWLFRFCVDGGSGTIHDITVENVWIRYDSFSGAKIWGKESASVYDVTLRNIRTSNQLFMCEELLYKNEYVNNVRIENDETGIDYQETILDRYVYEECFSDIQGWRNFYYYSRYRGSDNLNQLTYNSRWERDGSFPLVYNAGAFAPDNNANAVVGWKAPRAGKVKVYGIYRLDNKNPDGVYLSLYKNGFASALWRETLKSGDEIITHDMTETILDVIEGDMLYFDVDCKSSMDGDNVVWRFVVEYIE